MECTSTIWKELKKLLERKEEKQKGLEKNYKPKLKNNYLITHTSYEIINIKNKFISERKARDFKTTEDLLFSCDIGLSTVIFNKKIYSKNIRFVNLKTKEDFVMWLNMLKKGIHIYSLDKKLTKWTKSKDSLSASTFQKLIDSFKVYNTFMQFGFFKSIYLTLILSFNFLKKTIFNSW